MPIYTKKGDKGRTSLFVVKGGKKKRVSKDSKRIEAVGTIDELNSAIGVCVALSDSKKITVILENIQKNLLSIGSIIGGSDIRFGDGETKKLERVIDKFDKELPKLSNFILPGGGELGAHLHLSRSLARRAERRLVALNKKELDPRILKYINRLSDTLFVIARYVNKQEKITETTWSRDKR